MNLKQNSHLVRSGDGLCLGGGDYDPLPSHFSLELKSLVSRLLAVDPEQRLNLAEALKEEAQRKRESETGEKKNTGNTLHLGPRFLSESFSAGFFGFVDFSFT